jgi:hypothetical protein
MKKIILEVLLCEIQVHRNTVFEKNYWIFNDKKLLKILQLPHTIGLKITNPTQWTHMHWQLSNDTKSAPPNFCKKSIDVINWSHIG